MRKAVHVAGVIIAALWIGACSSGRAGARAATSAAEDFVGTWQLVAVTTEGHGSVEERPTTSFQ